jgi:AcrR family transcriptional regulator
MAGIAAGAGVAVGTLYNHFADREALLAALFDTRKRELVARLDEALAASDRAPFPAQLEATLRAIFVHFEAHRPFFRIAIQDEHSRKAAKGASGPMGDVYERLATLVRRGHRQRALRPDPHELQPSLLLGIVRAAVTRELYGEPSGDLLLQIPYLTAFFLQGAGR